MDARDAVVALQEAPEVTPAGSARLDRALTRFGRAARRGDDGELRSLAEDAQAAQELARDEAAPVTLRHDSFHVVVSRIGRAFTVCRAAGHTMRGAPPTVPGISR